MPSKLTRRVIRETAGALYQKGQLRPVIVELEAGGALLRLRLKGQRTSYPLTYAELYKHAVRVEIAAKAAERKRLKDEKRKAARAERSTSSSRS